ncbi:hypothetical protein niasHS_014793 [Heterodera schachtii]|uniref:Chorein N-terminal domain-containing protein n=1 Tax=Heterodera schachtii TaxID=97005 RepID=A0ABD2IIC3_HETSC
MTSILKNQIIKHLSAFARNLKPEQITMELLRGKGQLRDLELNEEVLAEKLELPPWLKIVSARCDRVSIKIPSWNKLRSAPIQLYVDDIRVTVRLVSPAFTCNSQPKTASSQSKSYSFADRVIETLSLYVQSVEIFFESDSGTDFDFGGSISLYSLALESISPNWSEEKDVDTNLTRIHDKTIRQVLFFKQLSWRLLKIEASAHPKCGADEQREPLRSKTNSPLRLLTVDGKCRISIKKSSQNCSLLAGKIELILKEIHWLATMLHLRMAIDFHKHLVDLANCQKKADSVAPFLGQQQNPFTDASSMGSSTNSAVPCAAFRRFDIPHSSYHLFISKVDLLLLDDSESNMLPSDWELKQGAMQAFLHRLRIDFYPEHRVFDSAGEMSHRHHWTFYQCPNSFTDLTKLQLDQFFRVTSTKLASSKRERFSRIWPQLVSQNVIIRLDNIILQQVTDQSTKKDALREMFSMDRKAKDRMPPSMSFFHLELSSYAFPASNSFIAPPDSVHLVMAPLELSPDAKSVRWLVYAMESIINAIDAPQICANSVAGKTELRPQIRLELFMPKIVLSSPSTDCPSALSPQNDPRLPKRLILQASTVLLSNFMLLNDPLVPLPIMFRGRLDDKHFKFVDWAQKNTVETKLLDELLRKSRNSISKKDDNADFFLDHEQRNEWILSIPSLWANCDFGPNTWELPFLTDLNIFGSILLDDSDGSCQKNCILVEPRTDLGITVDHFQFLHLNNLLTEVSSLMDLINSDRTFFRTKLPNLSSDIPLAIYCQCQKVHLRLILPAGPVPSPYDLKLSRADVAVSPSTTSMSCSDLPVDESASNSVQFPSFRNEILLKDEGNDSPRHRSQIQTQQQQEIQGMETAEIEGGLNVQGGLKTVQSVGELSTVSVTGRLSLADVQPSRKMQIGALNLPDFSGVQTPSDLESNLDETLSIGTTNSAEHFLIDGLLNVGEDEMVAGEEVVEAEEAVESVQDIAMLRRRDRTLARQMNVLDILVEDLNICASVVDGRSSVLGFASDLYFGERLGVKCGEVYDERGATFEPKQSMLQLNRSDGPTGESESKSDEERLRLEIRSEPKQTAIKLNVHGVDICVSDEVVSQLAPFIENPAENAHPPALELSVQKCRIEIKDPKKKFPIRIGFDELKFEDGPISSKQTSAFQ